jgi:steroid 5-alpha reductase family enzyme
MALPVVKSAVECADLSSTVLPYLYQLRPLPWIVSEAITNLAALKQLYLDTNPLVTSIAFSIALAPIFLLVSEVNKNYSQVDRVWSILPTIYNVHYAVYAWGAGLDTTRTNAVALASIIWSTRLTYNYWRRGGYSIGSEDYRWEFVKEYAGPVGMFLFNIVFISLAQSVLLCIVTFPSYVILVVQRATTAGLVPPFTAADGLAFGTMVGLVALTAVADQQQWNYQNAKQEYKATARVPAGYKQADLERGFNTKGFFTYARKPNYAFEQAVWGALYAWSCAASETMYNWSGIGFAAYLFLFQSSTWLTELLTERKYPEYKAYRAQTGKFFPTSLEPPKFGKTPQKIMNGTPSKDADATHARERYDLR